MNKLNASLNSNPCEHVQDIFVPTREMLYKVNGHKIKFCISFQEST